MGTCISKKNRVGLDTPTSIPHSRTLAELRESLVYHIIRFHQIILNCRKGVEQSIIDNNKETAVLIRMKEIYLRERMKEFQIMTEYLDKTIDEEFIVKAQMRKILKQGNMLLKKNLHSGLVIDDISIILQNNLDYNDYVKSEISKIEYNVKDVYLQIEAESQKRRVSQNSNFVRRRY